MLRLIGRLADGWIPPLSSYAPPEGMPAMQHSIDESAQAEDAPQAISGASIISWATSRMDRRGGLLQGPVVYWVETLTRFTLDLGFDTFVFWPSTDPIHQTERFAQEIVPQCVQLSNALGRQRKGRMTELQLG